MAAKRPETNPIHLGLGATAVFITAGLGTRHRPR